jgi:hypothetical protein
MTIGSAPISGDKLSSFVSTKVPDSEGRSGPFLGDELAFYLRANVLAL